MDTDAGRTAAGREHSMETRISRFPDHGALGSAPLAIAQQGPDGTRTLFGGRLASDAAALHRDVRDLVGAGRPCGAEVLAGLLRAETALERFQRRLEHPGAVCAGRSTPHLVRDARRSLRQACDLVEDELARRAH